LPKVAKVNIHIVHCRTVWSH